MRERLVSGGLLDGRTLVDGTGQKDSSISIELSGYISALQNHATDHERAETGEQLAQLELENRKLELENRRLASHVEAVRSGAASVLGELDTQMLARAVARQASQLLHADYALMELYDQDLPFFRTAYARQA